jgi:hypothetical protein
MRHRMTVPQVIIQAQAHAATVLSIYQTQILLSVIPIIPILTEWLLAFLWQVDGIRRQASTYKLIRVEIYAWLASCLTGTGPMA